MSDYRKLLVHVSDSERSAVVLSVATQLAAAQGAALHAVHAVKPLHLGPYLSSEAAMASAQWRKDAERARSGKARERVAEASRLGAMSTTFESPGGAPVDVMCALLRTADLLVMGQPRDDDPDGPSRRFVTRLLVQGSAPVLLVPGLGPTPSCGKRVMVAWSDTRECARALRDALPLLRRAASVELLRFGGPAPGGQEPLDEVQAYLRSHGVTAICATMPVRDISFSERMLTPTVVDASIAELLLSHAADTDADLIVMGGYGHARAYELVLGGVTRTLLGSMTVPVLMSH